MISEADSEPKPDSDGERDIPTSSRSSGEETDSGECHDDLYRLDTMAGPERGGRVADSKALEE